MGTIVGRKLRCKFIVVLRNSIKQENGNLFVVKTVYENSTTARGLVVVYFLIFILYT